MGKEDKKAEKLKSALRDNLKKRKQQSRRFKQTDRDEQEAPSMKLRDRGLTSDT